MYSMKVRFGQITINLTKSNYTIQMKLGQSQEQLKVAKAQSPLNPQKLGILIKF